MSLVNPPRASMFSVITSCSRSESSARPGALVTRITGCSSSSRIRLICSRRKGPTISCLRSSRVLPTGSRGPQAESADSMNRRNTRPAPKKRRMPHSRHAQDRKSGMNTPSVTAAIRKRNTLPAKMRELREIGRKSQSSLEANSYVALGPAIRSSAACSTTEIELSGFDDVGVARRVVVTGLAGGATAEV
jgi:hypothetical protein